VLVSHSHLHRRAGIFGHPAKMPRAPALTGKNACLI